MTKITSMIMCSKKLGYIPKDPNLTHLLLGKRILPLKVYVCGVKLLTIMPRWLNKFSLKRKNWLNFKSSLMRKIKTFS